ncbi:protein NUCLEAR FUSION DEFECTIVE 6, mitochondrial-like [Zingiber officinale]|uniref:protein NUCLEAR FUSION DEFECTIVE 6, mitochondrial-like n=1 Tax=Zingiber officinale TaxID=94328 RepID=UPI001C4BE0D6|nr:protein NUCLEAR FUSION DEFECTIVE 6, mitochondrial-like [Zingiber officinale]
MAAAIAGARRAFASRCVASHSLPLSASSRPVPSPSPATAFARLSRRKPGFGISRLPIELGCARSLMPFHSATATALLTSMLSARSGSWTWLSEEFARTL